MSGLDEGTRYVQAIAGARELRRRAYEAALLWDGGRSTFDGKVRRTPAPWPLLYERPTPAERSVGIPTGTVSGSHEDYWTRKAEGTAWALDQVHALIQANRGREVLP